MSVTNEQLKALRDARPDYKWKVQTASEYSCQLVAYFDARIVADIFDDVIGPANWQNKYEDVHGVVYCSVGVLTESGWVWKQDAGSESNMDAQKGQASDAFKRAAVRWGVGRFLYDLDIIKIKESIKNNRGKWVPAHNGKQIWDVTQHVKQHGLDRSKRQQRSQPAQAPVKPAVIAVDMATAEQQAQIQGLCKEIGWDGKKLGEYLAKAKATWNTLTAEQADKVIVRLIEKRNAQPKKPAASADVRWEGFDQTIGSTAVEMGWAKEQIDKKAIELTGKAFSEYEGAADVSLYKTLSSAMVTEFNKFEDAKAVAHA